METIMKSDDFSWLTVVIVTFNSEHCIASLSDSIGKLPNLVFSDNSSKDGTIKAIKKYFPCATLICNETNLGFGAANNLALEKVSTSYALILNPDCNTNPEFFTRLWSVTQLFPDVSVIAPQLIDRSGNKAINYRWPSSKWISRGPGADGPTCVGFICGAAMLFNMKRMEKSGFFDESFFLYYEDEDLCQRLFLDKQQMIIAPELEIIHYSRGSVKGPNPIASEFIRGLHHVQSKLLFTRKYSGIAVTRKLRRKLLAQSLIIVSLRLLIPIPKYWARLAGRIAGLLSATVDNKKP
jgi:N-acetylglucosaminyl-diphospho-decaprenol L-rhamnosyltransferase